MLSYHIADHSLNFFARGRGFTVGQDNLNFDLLRKMLTSPNPDIDKLTELADPRVAVATASNGLCEVVGNSVTYEGRELHNVWVDKILSFQQHNLPFEPIMKALADLQKNPGEKARLRLPVFVEQSKLGFLEDGRIAALKGVDRNYMDCHTHTFDNSVGKVLEMPREAVDPNPDNECSSGFHLGAHDYVVGHYGENHSRIMLCAFWPRDVVAVPRDYSGQKMRVAKYEVLEEMDRAKLVEFIEENRTLLRRHSQIAMPAENRLDVAIEQVMGDDDDGDQDRDVSALRDDPNVAFGTVDVGSQIISADQSMVIDVKGKTISIKARKKAAPKKAVKKAATKKKVVAKKASPAKKPILKKKAAAVKRSPAKKPIVKKKAAPKKPVKKVVSKKAAKRR